MQSIAGPEQAAGPVLTVFYEGDTVTLNGSLVKTWQPVTCAGANGYIKKTYLSTTKGGSTTENTFDRYATFHIWNSNDCGHQWRWSELPLEGKPFRFSNYGSGRGCRGGTARRIQRELGARGLRWKERLCQTQFVTINDGAVGGGNNTGYSSGDQVVVANTGGQGVRLRSKGSSTASIIVVLAEGEGLAVRRGSSGDWVAVTYRTSNGFVHKDYLAKGTTSTPRQLRCRMTARSIPTSTHWSPIWSIFGRRPA